MVSWERKVRDKIIVQKRQNMARDPLPHSLNISGVGLFHSFAIERGQGALLVELCPEFIVFPMGRCPRSPRIYSPLDQRLSKHHSKAPPGPHLVSNWL